MESHRVRRLMLGTFVRPGAETDSGQLRVEAVYAYLIRAGDRLLLFDTGLGEADQETEDWYRPVRQPLGAALAKVGVGLEQIDLVINCHLHFDHIGGNRLFPRVPIVTQRQELKTARAGGYTMPELVDFAGAHYLEVDGQIELLPGIQLIPTPGHVNGHQSLVVSTGNGTVIVAGQAHDTASNWAADALAARARQLGHQLPLPTPSAWMSQVLALDPKQVVFAHDASVWTPD